MGFYRKKPVVIEAERWSGSNWHQILAFAGKGNVATDGKDLLVHTLEGTVTAPAGHWIVKDEKGEFWAVPPESFEATYEEVEDETA